MTPTALHPRIPDALPVEVEPPRVLHLPPRPAEPPSPEEGGGGLKPLQYLRYRWATVVFLGGFLAAGLAFAAYSLIPAKYTTYSIIRVAPQDPRIYYNEDPHGRGDFASYLKTQAGLLRSHFVLTAALRDPEVAALPMLKEQADPVRYLEEELQIDFSDGSELIKPKLAGDDPRAITLIVNAIHRAFFAEVVEGERKRKQARLRDIETAKGRMLKELEDRQPPPKAADQPAESLPGVGPNLAASQVARLREKLDGAEVRQKQIEDEKRRLARKKEHPETDLPPVPPGYLAQLEGDPEIAGINRRVAQWQKQVSYLVDLSGDKNNPAVKELKAKIAEAAQERERVRKERAEGFQTGQLQEVVRKLQADDEKLDAELASLKVVQEKTRTEMKEYEAKLVGLLPETDGPKDFGKVDVKSRSEIVSGMTEKANLLRLELSAPARVMNVQEASVPMKREVKKQLMGTVAAGVIGFLLVGLGVVGYESRVRRAMTVADVQKATLGPVLGAVPAVHTATGQPNPEVLAVAEEAIEKARANLMQQFGKPGGKVVLVTSAIGDEGRPFFARELALSFARAGAQTLLADFDLRQPTLHEPFEVPNEVGFCELLTGESDLPSAARILPHGIALLPAGRWADVVRQYLSAERLGQMLGELRARFDVVVVNAHPILAVAETALAGRAADAVVLTAEKYESRLPLVARAQEKVAGLAPEAFGVVVLGASRDECLQ